MKSRNLYIALLILLLTSCLKKEIPVTALKPGNVETVTIEIGYPYLNQVYYDCETNTIVATNTKYDWDLAFECSTNGFHILLNNATGMLSAKCGNVPFSSINSISGLTWEWDSQTGNLDSTALGNWQSTQNVYVLDRQFDENGNHLGYIKIQGISVNNQFYTLKYANLDGSNENTINIPKNNNLNFIHFSFNNGGMIKELEPEKNSWDLLFTNHQHKFSNLSLPFVLTQVLSNKYNGVVVAEDNNNNFFKIILTDTVKYTFSNLWNEIGYDWKIRNSADNSYTIDPNKSFLLKTTSGLYYKIRFIDFYNKNGSKGYPTFEIQKL